MGVWGSENFTDTYKISHSPQTFEDIISQFPSGLKQAMFAAASHTTIARSTWNGCALNAAGMEVGKQDDVRSFEAAAKAFNITYALAKMFVVAWDSMRGSDVECTGILRDTIEKVGLFSEPGDKPPRIIRRKVYESQQAQLHKQFQTLMESNSVPDTDVALELLVGSCS
jgi:hypothetical protein